MNVSDADQQFQDSVIDAVHEDPTRYVVTHGHWLLECPKVDGLPAPRVGETLRCYGRGIGHPVRGIVIGGRVYRYLTEAADEASRHHPAADAVARDAD